MAQQPSDSITGSITVKHILYGSGDRVLRLSPFLGSFMFNVSAINLTRRYVHSLSLSSQPPFFRRGARLYLVFSL